MKKIVTVLLLVFFLGAILRFYRLGEIPVGFHRDEAFLGYNAYSILRTGKDMNGNFLPFHLESFLYSPAGYSYLSIPFIKLFGLSAFSVRFPSALFGSLTILITYFLTRELFKGKNNSLGIKNLKLDIPFIAAAMLAISPWHVNLSRTATENVIVVFFIALGVLLYLQWLMRNNLGLLIASFLSFGITFLMYQAPRAFLPLFIPLLIIIFFKSKFLNRKKILSVAFLFITTILVPIFVVLSSHELSLRIRTVSIFATQETQLTIDEQIRQDGVSDISRFITRAFHNKIINYNSQFLQNYFKHFSFNFLFTDQGLPDRYRVPLAGILYVYELPLLLLGIVAFLKKKSRVGLFLISWVILVPVGSALTFDDVPNLQRTLLVFPVVSIISSFGLLFLISLIQNRLVTNAIVVGLGIVVVYSLLFYMHQYYIHGRLYRPWYRHDGYKELVGKVDALLPNYKKAIITDRESAPTIFFLFYEKYDPSLFQKETKNTTMRDFDRIGFSKYEFSQEECPLRTIEKNGKLVITGEKGILYVNSGLCKVPDGGREIGSVRRTDNSLVFRIFEVE